MTELRLGGGWPLPLAVAFVAFATVLLPAIAQGNGRCPTPASLAGDWPVQSTAEAGFDEKALCGLDEFIARWPEANLHAVVVARHGRLVFERYYSGPDQRFGSSLVAKVQFTPEVKHDLRSISKSVTSLLVGIAKGEGKFPPLESAVLDFFPEYGDLRTPEKMRVTFHHLLTMSSGLAWNEASYSNPANSWNRMKAAVDPVRYVLEQAIVEPPGRLFNYNGGGTTILGRAVVKATGVPIDRYAREKLFAPLGIADADWGELPATGEPAAAAGLRLRPRDLAKIGQLMLADGVWQGRRILPAGWVEQSIRPWIVASPFYQYGYQWWLGDTDLGERRIKWSVGRGLGGQRLYIVPALDLVVAINSGLYAEGPHFALQETIPRRILEDVVLPAAKN